ncbi:nucleotidyltransferase family protein [Pseudomonas oryzihabitans]|uniref:nucleotidyltransferase family protein n=1 Tax=Pseudomonas oryzihabitans TaxID=47885 RepID=UPI003D06E602
MPGIQVLILAAGAGSRFRAAGGGDKLQATLPGPSELTVLQATFRLWRGLGLPCLAVVSDSAPWRAALARQEGLAVLSLPTTGMGDSLAAAVRRTPAASGWLVALGDMPFVQSATARQLLELQHPGRIVVPTYQGQRGHPVLFGRNFASALGELAGDEGAKRLLREGAVLEREVADAGIHCDIDTPADLENTRQLT